MENEVLLTALGNPVVDITVKLKNLQLFHKYNLPQNRHYPTTNEFLNTIAEDFGEYAIEIITTPGGCSQNTLRIFQWLMNSKFNSAIIGSVGADENASFLKEDLQNSGVITHYTTTENWCTSFVYNLTYKDALTHLFNTTSAASCYTTNHLLNNAEAIATIKNSKIIHIEGFFTVHSAEVGIELMKICAESNIITSFNINGEYVPNTSADAVIPFIKNCHIVIGTRQEFLACCRVMNIPADDFLRCLTAVHRIMLNHNVLEKTSLKVMEKYKKILIVTDSSAPIYCVTAADGVIKFDVPRVEETLIKDETAAGDSFLAGIFFGLLRELPLEKCLEIGCKVAAEIILEHGCNIPKKPSSAVISV